MKTYVLTLSHTFPKGTLDAGEPTGFKEKLLAGKKIHTIRANYEWWLKRINQIQAGEACLSIRQWSGKPYRSKQVEIARLTKKDGVGIEQVTLPHIANRPDIFNQFPGLDTNDGLTREQWLYWFAGYDTKEPLAIIHFTPFRYFKLRFNSPEFGGIRNITPLTHSQLTPQEQPHTEQEFQMAMKSMDQETMLRTLYIPFIMQDVFFDYTDTVLTLAAHHRIEPLKKVCREIKNQRREYEYRQRECLDLDHRKAEGRETEQFIDEHFPEFNAEYRMVKWKIGQERPRLDDDNRTFIACTYMGLMIYKALQTICGEADNTIRNIWKHAGHSILTDEVTRTNELLKICLGDCDIISNSDLQTSADRLVEVIHACEFKGKVKWD